MSRMRAVLYSFEDGFHNLKRGGITGIVSIVTIAFTMLNVGLFFIVWINIAPLLEGCMDEIKIIGYLKEGIGEERIGHLSGELSAIPNVTKVHFVSKSDALERFKEMLGEERYILEGLRENPLPASFELIIDEGAGLGAVDRVSQMLSGKMEFEEIQSGREWVRRLSVFLFLVKAIGYLVGSVLLVVSIFIISNTVRMTLINRREEIEIMRLVGASRWFIKTPFFIEGLLNGFFGALISVGLLFVLYKGVKYRLSPFIMHEIGMIRISFIPVPVVLLLIGVGMGVGGIGSIFSLRL